MSFEDNIRMRDMIRELDARVSALEAAAGGAAVPVVKPEDLAVVKEAAVAEATASAAASVDAAVEALKTEIASLKRATKS